MCFPFSTEETKKFREEQTTEYIDAWKVVLRRPNTAPIGAPRKVSLVSCLYQQEWQPGVKVHSRTTRKPVDVYQGKTLKRAAPLKKGIYVYLNPRAARKRRYSQASRILKVRVKVSELIAVDSRRQNACFRSATPDRKSYRDAIRSRAAVAGE